MPLNLLSCKIRSASQTKYVSFNDAAEESIAYWSDQSYLYRYNCKSTSTNAISSQQLRDNCEMTQKLELKGVRQQLVDTLVSAEGLSMSVAESKVNTYFNFFAHQSPFRPDERSEIRDLDVYLEKIFMPSPTSGAGQQIVLGHLPKGAGIDPMVKQIAVWNLKDYPGTNMPVSVDEVVRAMYDLKEEYWDHPVNEKIRQDCLNNLVPEWSDLMFHYYCQIGSARKCFTLQAKDQGRTLGGYTTAYEICKNDDDFKWIARNQADIFRYIMFTVGDPEAFNQADQDEAINRFYGVTDVTNCSQRPRRNAPPNPEFPCGRKIGRITLKEQENWALPAGSKASSNSGAKDKPSQNKSDDSAPKVDGQAIAKSNSDAEVPQLSQQVGTKGFGAYWYLTPSGTGDCRALCASKGGIKQDILLYTQDLKVCRQMGEKILKLHDEELNPYLKGTGACEAGCIVQPLRKQFFVCTDSNPEVNSITLGWERMCPCRL